MKRLYKSRNDKVLDGVCAGIAKYFQVDAVIIRLIWIVASIFIGQIFWGIVAYLIAMVIMPTEPRNIGVPLSSPRSKRKKEAQQSANKADATGQSSSSSQEQNESMESSTATTETDAHVTRNEGDSHEGEASYDSSELEKAELYEDFTEGDDTEQILDEEKPNRTKKSSSNTTLLLGIGLVAFGAMLLLDRLTFGFLEFNIRTMMNYMQSYFWPILLVGIGIFLITRRKA